MAENLEIIANILKKHKPTVNIPQKKFSFIEAVDYLDCDQKIFEPDILYLGKVSAFSVIPKLNCPVNILLLQDSDHAPECQNPEMLNVIILEDYPPLEDLHEEIVSFLKNRKDLLQKSLRLYDCLSSGKGLQVLVDLGEELLGNPLIVSDVSFKVLAYSQKGSVDESLWNKVKEKGFLPYENAKLARLDGATENIMKGERPVIIQPRNSKYRSLGWRLVISGKIVGHISLVDSNKPFEENDIQLLMVLCNVVSIELQKSKNYWQAKGMIFESLISDLFAEKLQNRDMVNERLKFLHIKLNKYLFVLVADYIIDSAVNTPLPYIQELLEATISGSKCAVYNNQVVMLVTRMKKTPFSQEELLKLNTILEENEMTGGVSRSFQDISKMKNYYSQSCKANELGLRLDRKRNLYFYEDYVEFHLIEMANKQGEVTRICNPLILELMEYDNQNNGDLINSLYVYLLSGNNLAEAAPKLGIHRNSMDYRIKKIEEILNVKIDDPQVAFSLRLSLKILEFSKGIDFLERSPKDKKYQQINTKI